MKILVILGAMALLFGCSSGKKVNVPVIEDFDIEKYCGVWHEIARTPNRFQKNMVNVTATYTLKENGDVSVLNRGYNYLTNEWSEAEGRAVNRDEPNFFKVYFFLFFGGNYKVAYVDSDYSIALVSGGTEKYLWILARNNFLPPSKIDFLIDKAVEMGYSENLDLIYTRQ